MYNEKEPLHDVHKYDIEGNKWSPTSSLNYDRARLTCCVIHDYIYAFKGYRSKKRTPNDYVIESLNVKKANAKKKWRHLEVSLPEISHMTVHIAAPLSNTEIFIFGS